MAVPALLLKQSPFTLIIDPCSEDYRKGIDDNRD
jgi:hypothetical protein